MKMFQILITILTFIAVNFFINPIAIVLAQSADLKHAIGNAETVKVLIDAGLDVKSGEGKDALVAAVRGGFNDTVKVLISAGLDLNKVDLDGESLLNIAVEGGHLNTVQLLLSLGVDINKTGKYGKTALLNAIETKKTNIVKYLLTAGADVNARDISDETALMYAMRDLNNLSEILNSIISARPDFYAKDRHGDSALSRLQNYLYSEIFDENLIVILDSYEPPRFLDVAIIKRFLDAGVNFSGLRYQGKTLLICAVAARREDIVKLLAGRVDINEMDECGQTALIWAVSRKGGGSSLIIRELLAARANVNLQDRDGHTALGLARENGFNNAAEMLLAAGANIGTRDKGGKLILDKTSAPAFKVARQSSQSVAAKSSSKSQIRLMNLLIDAIEQNSLITAKKALAAGININRKLSQPYDDATPLIYAARLERTALVKLFLQHHPKVNARDRFGATALVYACSTINYQLVKLLLAASADANLGSLGNTTPLIYATSQLNPDISLEKKREAGEIVKLLLASGVDINAIGDEHRTPLMWAVINNDLECIKMLIAAGADVNRGLYGIDPPIMTAIQNRNHDIVDLLVSAGAKLQVVNSAGNSPLAQAVSIGDKELVEKLLAHGADVNVIERDSTLVMTAIYNHKYELVKLLIAAGADVKFKNKAGETIMVLAAKYFCPRDDRDYYLPEFPIEVVEALIAAGAPVDGSDQYGNSPLPNAARCGRVDIVAALLKAGADVNVNLYAGESLLSLIDKNKPVYNREYVECINLLKAAGAQE